MANTPRDPEAAVTERVILVHGTFAQDRGYWESQTWWRQVWAHIRRPSTVKAKDPGDAWWLPGGAFASAVDAAGAGRFACEDPPFHWRGDNRESERRVAGQMLLAKLREFESRGIRYHLVGHSHGGSVIWAALRDAARRRLELPGLRTWTSVGTPYLQFRPSWRSLWVLMPLIPYFLTIPWIFAAASDLWRAWDEVGRREWIIAAAAGAAMLPHVVVAILMAWRVLAVIAAAWTTWRKRRLRSSHGSGSERSGGGYGRTSTRPSAGSPTAWDSGV